MCSRRRPACRPVLPTTQKGKAAAGGGRRRCCRTLRPPPPPPACRAGEGLRLEFFVDKFGSGCCQPLRWHEPSADEVRLRPRSVPARLPASCRPPQALLPPSLHVLSRSRRSGSCLCGASSLQQLRSRQPGSCQCGALSLQQLCSTCYCPLQGLCFAGGAAGGAPARPLLCFLGGHPATGLLGSACSSWFHSAIAACRPPALQVSFGEALVETMLLGPARQLRELADGGEVPREQLKRLLLQVRLGRLWGRRHATTAEQPCCLLGVLIRSPADPAAWTSCLAAEAADAFAAPRQSCALVSMGRLWAGHGQTATGRLWPAGHFQVSPHALHSFSWAPAELRVRDLGFP